MNILSSIIRTSFIDMALETFFGKVSNNLRLGPRDYRAELTGLLKQVGSLESHIRDSAARVGRKFHDPDLIRMLNEKMDLYIKCREIAGEARDSLE